MARRSAAQPMQRFKRGFERDVLAQRAGKWGQLRLDPRRRGGGRCEGGWPWLGDRIDRDARRRAAAVLECGFEMIEQLVKRRMRDIDAVAARCYGMAILVARFGQFFA